ncbi:MAG: DUF6338 family protein [Actinomycetota bacterium]|nr:DUF6338 family protein [Actinomycetota bacterium]
MGLPSTAPQLLIILAFVIPGAVYQAVRLRLIGPYPPDQDATDKLLRAIAASALLDGLYAVLAGKLIAHLAAPLVHGETRHVPSEPWQLGLAAIVFLFFVPSVAAAGTIIFSQRLGRGPWLERLFQGTYDPTPRAWDYGWNRLFSRDDSPCFVRIRTNDDLWVGGYLGFGSFASSYPHADDLFMEYAYTMNSDGSFGGVVPGSQGMWVRCDDVRTMEFIAPPERTSSPSEARQED